MNKKIIEAEPFFCEKTAKIVVLETFEDEKLSDDLDNPMKAFQFTECASCGVVPDCTFCPKNITYLH